MGKSHQNQQEKSAPFRFAALGYPIRNWIFDKDHAGASFGSSPFWGRSTHEETISGTLPPEETMRHRKEPLLYSR